MPRDAERRFTAAGAAVAIALAMTLTVTLAFTPSTASAQILPPTHTEKFVGDWWDVDAQPDFRAETMQKEIPAGRSTELSVLFINEGEASDFEAVEEPATATENTSAEKELAHDRTGTTAKNLVATLEGTGPVDVETSTASASTEVLGGGSTTLPFTVTVDEDADPGTYDLNLTVSYRYLEDSAVEYRSGNYQPSFFYRNVEETLPLRVTVEENAVFRVTDVSVAEGELRLGRDPTVAVTYTNVGRTTAHEAEASLTPSAPFSTRSTVQNADTTFLGTVAPGDTATANYDLTVSRSGLAKNYSLTSRITYEDAGGNADQSKPLKVVLDVKPFQSQFSVQDTELESDLSPGGETAVTVTFRNDGERPATDAVARLSVSDPFTSTSDTAYLGTLGPGDAAEGRFRLSAGSDALPKTYGVDAEIKYRDRNGLTQISDPMKAEVPVTEGGGGPVPGFTPLAALAALGAALLLRRRA